MSSQTPVTEFEIIVLGMGPGGEELAGVLAERGRSVLAVDERLFGGECPYFGCIPTKMMVRGAEVLAEGRRINLMAGSADISPDYTPVADRIRDEATDDWDDTVAVERLEGKGGTFVRGTGRLAGRDDDGRLRVVVGDVTYRAEHVAVATGTAPAVPDIDGLAELRTPYDASGLLWTNREVVHARTAPASLIVIGGGPIGCEMAQAFARFGTKVDVVAREPRLLPRDEPDAGDVLATVFEREGITVHAGATPVRARRTDDGVEVALADGTVLTAAKVLCAAGRVPSLPSVGLDSVGLDPSARALTVDDQMRVLRDGEPVEGVYAIGDIAGHGAFTHLSVWQARVLAAHLLGDDDLFGGYHGLAWTTFTDPEVGRVGMSEQEARDAGLTVRVGVAQIASNTRGWIHGPGNDGFVKVVEDADRGILVGATVVAPGGGEILGLLTVAVHARVPLHTLRTMHYVFPTQHRAVLEAIGAIE
ncbi:MAG TPA: FAD-dependent oxidoreductase [Jatrophihabitantaceae bacterium]|jgi:pyruvate/2-oxoglutarate dehydrogenase complex dihydrolipoamide dehydrogenase (E3) component